MRRVLVLTAFLAGCASGTGVAGTSPTTSIVTTTTTVTTTTMVTTTTTDPRPAVCDEFAEEPVVAGVVTDPALVEISGIARSESMPGVLWAHNDSGSPPRLWAIDSAGAVLGHHEVRARNVDWEDIALGPGPDGGWWVYLADIGDNLQRRDRVWLYRFAEPVTPAGVVDEVESLMVTYPDGPADAEALLVDPWTGDSFIITKTATGRSTVSRVPAGAWAQDAAVAETVATIDLGPLAFVTAADISADGTVIGVRTYRDVWLWERDSDETVAEAIVGRRCRAPAPDESQGESIMLDESGYSTLSEGDEPVVYRFVTSAG